MTTEAALLVVALGGDPGLLTGHVLHEGAADHHSNDDGGALRQVLLHGHHVRALFVGAQREALETLDAEGHGLLHILFAGLLAAALVGVSEPAEGQRAALRHLFHGPVDV